MKPLIDGDILRYEICSCGEYVDDNGVPRMRGIDYVIELLEDKLKLISEMVGATEPPCIFLTMCKTTHKVMKCPRPYMDNFRVDVAKTKPYKGNRKNNRPYHYANLTAYMLANFECVVAEGL